MKNSNYACFNCKISKRFTDISLGHKCNLCGNKLIYVFYKFVIPPKSDIFKWNILQSLVHKYNTTQKKYLLEKYKDTLNEIQIKIKYLNKNDIRQKYKLNELYENI